MRTLLLALVAGCGLPQPSSAPAESGPAPFFTEPAGLVRSRPLIEVDRHLPPPVLATGLGDAPSGPLPEGVTPVATALALTVDPRTAVFHGEVRHTLAVSEPTDHIWLHGQGLDVQAVVLHPEEGEPLVGRWTLVADPGVARIDLPSAVPEGTAELRIVYQAAFDTQLSGLFKVEEQGDSFALAKSESIQARKYVPGWDEPRYKVPWSIELTVPDGMVAISNGVVADRRPASGDLVRWTFAETPPLPTYLLSLAVGPFERVVGPSLPATADRPRIPVVGYARRGRGAQLERILRLTGPMVDFFEDALGQPYPYEKLDIVAAPAWPSGATELAAAITYRESRILLDDAAGMKAVRSMESVHAHEIAHMWFGNEVTPPWWDDLWLKEGLATWGSTVTRQALQPEAGHGLDALADTLTLMGRDVLPTTRAVREPIAGNADIRNAYDGVTYVKGRAVIHMLDSWLGPEVFRPALGRYVAARSGGTADAPAFHAELSAALDRPEVLSVLQSFVDQRGVPLLELEVDCSDGVVARVTQSPQGALGVPPPEPRSWTVPVCLRPRGGAVTCAVLDGPSLSVPLEGACPAWVHPNPGGATYARVGLSADAWAAAAADLEGLATEDALVLVDSALAAVDASSRTVAEVLPLLDAAARHADRRVATRALRAAASWLDLPLRSGSREAVAQWLGGHARERIARARRQDTDEARLFETDLLEILVGSLDDKLMTLELVDRAQSRVGYRGAAQPGALDSDRLGLGVTAAVRMLGPEFAAFLLASLETMDDPRLQPAAYAALAGARDPALASQLRALVLAGGLDPRDAWNVVTGLLAEEETRGVTQDWVLANLDALVGVVPSQWRRRVPTLALAGCDRGFLAALRARHAASPGLLPGADRPFSQVEQQVERCTVVRAVRPADVEAAFPPTDAP